MAFKEKSTGKSNYEELLSMIARTTQWEFPDEITRFCDAMDKASDALGRAGTVLQEDGVFECSARDTALACSDRIVQNISDADFTAQAKLLRQRIETFNDVICEAQNVRLPGDKLSKESEQAIMNATEPMDWIVPGLGTVTGVMGIAGANLISRMLASNREEEAKKEYKRLIGKVQRERGIIKSLPAVDVNGIWPAPSTDGSKDKAIGDSPLTNGSNNKGSGGGGGLSTIGAAGACVGGGAVAGNQQTMQMADMPQARVSAAVPLPQAWPQRAPFRIPPMPPPRLRMPACPPPVCRVGRAVPMCRDSMESEAVPARTGWCTIRRPAGGPTARTTCRSMAARTV